MEKIKIGNYRWRICALLFFGTTINYIDRQVLGILAPTLQTEIGWSESEYGLIVAAFQTAYALGFLIMGYLMDKIGTRIGYAFAVGFWSFAAIAHAAVKSVFGFGGARFALGFGEAGNFPASIKTIAEWFPKKERSFAAGIFNSGSSIGAIIAPWLVPIIALTYGWQWAFISTGLLGFIFLIFWLKWYRNPSEHPHLSAEEKAYIQQDGPVSTVKLPWIKMIQYRQAWAYAVGKFLTDPIWWFFLGWLPKFLNSQHGLTLDKIGPPLIVIYIISDVGSIAGGWLSSYLIRKGWTVNAGRKTTMLVAALTVTPIYFASQVSDLWTAVAIIGLAMAAHQAWSANLYTLVSDMFPQQAVGSVIGFGCMFGATAGAFAAAGAGLLLQTTGSYVPLFFISGIGYLIALGIIHLLVPKMKPVTL